MEGGCETLRDTPQAKFPRARRLKHAANTVVCLWCSHQLIMRLSRARSAGRMSQPLGIQVGQRTALS